MAQTFKKTGIVDSEACRITGSASHFQHYRLISLLQRRSSHCDDLQFILCWLALTGLVSHVMFFFCFKSDENNSLTVCELVPEWASCGACLHASQLSFLQCLPKVISKQVFRINIFASITEKNECNMQLESIASLISVTALCIHIFSIYSECIM